MLKKANRKVRHEIAEGIPRQKDKKIQLERLTMSSHWCTATATWVPNGLVNTNTSPGTALSGLKDIKHDVVMVFVLLTKIEKSKGMNM